MASNSLHLTTMCIQYKPTVVACFCILVACKWSNWEIPLSNEKKPWYSYVDPTVTAELLQQLTEEFLVIFEASPSRLKEKIMAIPDNVAHTPTLNPNMNHVSFEPQDAKKTDKDGKDHRSGDGDPHKHRSSRLHDPTGPSSQQMRERDKHHRERLAAAAQQKAMMAGQVPPPSKPLPPPGSHQRPSVDPKLKQPHSRPPSMPPGGYQPREPRDILREAVRDSPFGLAGTNSGREHMKDAQKQRSSGGGSDYLLKPNAQTDYNNDKQRMRLESSSSRNRHDVKQPGVGSAPYLKTETENIKKHLSASSNNNTGNSAPGGVHPYLSKPPFVSTSQPHQQQPQRVSKSPFDSVEASKSVLKHMPPQSQPGLPMIKVKQELGSAGNDSIFMPPPIKQEIKEPIVKEEPASPIKTEVSVPPVIKRPSLFSPEKTPPRVKKEPLSPIMSIKRDNLGELPPLSPLASPVSRRNRNYSSGSEPELRPVMKKIDQVEGFENLMRDSTIGMDKIHNVSDHELKEQEAKPNVIEPPPVSTAVVNGMETNPTVISNLLREAAAATTDQEAKTLTGSTIEKDHHHHKSKKKNKEKHKHKDKEKSKEEREKKKKHKDKDRERHKDKHQHQPAQGESSTSAPIAEPIKLKIQKDKIQMVPESSTSAAAASPMALLPGQGLKIKIPRDKIKTEVLPELGAPAGASTTTHHPPSIKLKIPKEVINYNNCISGLDGSSRKRDRDRSPNDIQPPPNKVHKSSSGGSSRDAKQNGRHSYSSGSSNSKVAHMGDGDASLHRSLAESKYTHKSTSS
ncbi:unnamed protein product [Acanthoscelides obtectus]|nr:unnamed protein product [Acanthoscelides obtectus]CAK1671439.1 Cyclin-T2 [Acanthoscelides obtectus]